MPETGACRRHLRIDRNGIMRMAAAEIEGRKIHRHCFAVQLDGATQGVERQRHKTLLPRMAEHEHVGAERRAEQLRGNARGIDKMHVLAGPRHGSPS